MAVLLASGSELTLARGLGEDPVAFGDWLAEQGDYYRAIGEYQRALYHEPGEPTRTALLLRVARAYALGNQAEKAAEIGGRLARESPAEELRPQALLVLAFARDRAGDHDTAASLLRKVYEPGAQGSIEARARLLAGIALLRSGARDGEAARVLEPVTTDPQVGAAAVALSRAADRLHAVRLKSPALAGVLSGVLPGLGQLYLGEPDTAVAAFGVNALFIWATVDAFRSQHYGLGAAALAVESLWYGGAIFGAVAGAHRYNRDYRARVIDEAQRGLDPAVDILPLPRGVGVSATGRF